MSLSNSRKRNKTIAIRVDETEAAQLAAFAERAGLSIGAFIRQQILDAEPPRQSRRPPVEKELLAYAMRHIGKIGSNVNQLARRANHGNVPHPDNIEEACAAMLELRDAVLEALGIQKHKGGANKL